MEVITCNAVCIFQATASVFSTCRSIQYSNADLSDLPLFLPHTNKLYRTMTLQNVSRFESKLDWNLNLLRSLGKIAHNPQFKLILSVEIQYSHCPSPFTWQDSARRSRRRRRRRERMETAVWCGLQWGAASSRSRSREGLIRHRRHRTADLFLPRFHCHRASAAT